jgi:hypothetical protein
MGRVQDSGIVGGVNVGLPILMTMGAFLTIALYNVIELTLLIFATFRQRKGLYFWSMLVATWGIAPHGVGFIFKFFQVVTSDMVSAVIVGIGWASMVIGQSVVLYSRLHLIVQDERRTRWVLYMITFNAIVIGIPLYIMALGANSKASARFLPLFLIFDKIQLVLFSVQEGIISGIYIYETIRLLGFGGNRRDVHIRNLLTHLILVNVVVLVFDITLIATQFSGHYEIQTTYKTAVYSVKLKIEFSVLNRLIHVVKDDRRVDGNLPLDTFISSKKTRSRTLSGRHSSFVRMDDISRAEKNEADSSARISKAAIEELDSISHISIHAGDSRGTRDD